MVKKTGDRLLVQSKRMQKFWRSLVFAGSQRERVDVTQRLPFRQAPVDERIRRLDVLMHEAALMHLADCPS
jgi:hypothetical protein